MISDQDITKLKTVFATKEDLADLRLEVGDMKDYMEERFTHLDVKLDHLLVTVDDFVGSVRSVQEDNAAGSVAQYRHDRQILALADHVGFTLPEE